MGKGLKGEELSEIDHAAFQAIALSTFRRHQFIANRIQYLQYGGSRKDRAQIQAFHLYQYPGLRRTYDAFTSEAEVQRSAFGDVGQMGFGHLVRTALAELDQSSPPVPAPTYTPY